VNALANYSSLRVFYAANPSRERSPEWDYGVGWADTDRPWPTSRLSWIVETGELYLYRFGADGTSDAVIVVAVIPKVGEYPYPTDGRREESWREFKDAQTVERVLDGWAEQGGDLSWLEARLAAHIETEVAAA
jgi:hypothetical protein